MVNLTNILQSETLEKYVFIPTNLSKTWTVLMVGKNVEPQEPHTVSREV